MTLATSKVGLLNGVSGKKKKKKPTCQCKRHKRQGFNHWVRKIPCRRACNPLQYSCLENPMDRGAWRATVHGVLQSQTWLKRLSMHTCSLIKWSFREMCLTCATWTALEAIESAGGEIHWDVLCPGFREKERLIWVSREGSWKWRRNEIGMWWVELTVLLSYQDISNAQWFHLWNQIACHLAAQFLVKLLLSLSVSYQSLSMVAVSGLNISESLMSGA